MNKRKKKFDCLAIIADIHKRMEEEYAGLTPEQQDERRTEWLAQSQDSIARVWRGEAVVPESDILRPGDPFFKFEFPTDDFDAVEMKHDIQRNLSDQYEGVPFEERLNDINEHLRTSNAPLARLWRGEKVSTEGQPALDELLADARERKSLHESDALREQCDDYRKPKK